MLAGYRACDLCFAVPVLLEMYTCVPVQFIASYCRLKTPYFHSSSQAVSIAKKWTASCHLIIPVHYIYCRCCIARYCVCICDLAYEKGGHKGVSGKPGKWVYITPYEFDLVQVKFIRVQIVKYKNDPQRYFWKIKKFPQQKFSRNFFSFENIFPP